MAPALVFGTLLAIGMGSIVLSGSLSRALSSHSHNRMAPRASHSLGRPTRVRAPRARRASPALLAQVLTAAVAGIAGWAATGLLGMMLLLGGLGALLPPFIAAPARRRRHAREALAWLLWSRQLAELARAGLGLTDALIGSVPHAPKEIAARVERTAAAIEVRGLEAALDELAELGNTWEPEVAVGLRMAATSGGSVAEPLLDLSGRISDIVDLHRSKTEAVVQLWTQTIALLSLAGGVVTLMYHNNPDYFEPYEEGTGQLVLVGIAGLLLLSTAFLVYHSVVREENSVLVPPRRRSLARDPI